MKFLRSPKFLIFLVVFVNFLGYGIVFPILPLLTEQYGGDPIMSGILIAIFSLMKVSPFSPSIMGAVIMGIIFLIGLLGAKNSLNSTPTEFNPWG
ncbi:hypothetical protein HZB96_04230 [Candidatus Gottesmanbacteria bacterium]|nr:hypothetical protein [Candidatus Gottesmanbacteria bacterium]MBI5451935.1 hypothetical protein [Candidatus Gottesmanbacteria bacterium]